MNARLWHSYVIHLPINLNCGMQKKKKYWVEKREKVMTSSVNVTACKIISTITISPSQFQASFICTRFVIAESSLLFSLSQVKIRSQLDQPVTKTKVYYMPDNVNPTVSMLTFSHSLKQELISSNLFITVALFT